MSSLAQVVGLQRWLLQRSASSFRRTHVSTECNKFLSINKHRFYSSGENEKAMQVEGTQDESQDALATGAVAPQFAAPPVTSYGHQGYAVPSTTYSPEVNSSTAYIGGPPKLLMRDFVHQSLYHPTKGYFNSPRSPVGRLENPINYFKIYSREEYNAVVNQRYKELEVAFLTPAELFTPWYGGCLARHIHELTFYHPQIKASISEDEPLVIYEVGGGNGTLAKDILNWLRDNKPEQYARTTYTCVEISPRLAAQQFDTVIERAGHRGHFRVLRGNALDKDVWGPADHAHCFVIMMEVLDNLPHDRVFRRSPKEPWQQTVVRSVRDSNIEDGPWYQEEEALSDALLKRALTAFYEPPSVEARLDEKLNSMLDFLLSREHEHQESRGEALFVPSTAQAFLELLQERRPNHSVIAADFDKLPDVRVPGRNAPLVAQKVAGRNIDHDTVMVPWGCADIFYPTDFEALCRMYRAAAQHVWGDKLAAGGKKGRHVVAEHYRQGSVLMRYKEMFHTHTISNYNPMVDDFINARFFLGHSWGAPGPKLEKYMPRPPMAAVAVAAASAQPSPAHQPAAPAAAAPSGGQPASVSLPESESAAAGARANTEAARNSRREAE